MPNVCSHLSHTFSTTHAALSLARSCQGGASLCCLGRASFLLPVRDKALSFPINRINSSRKEFHLGGRSGLGASESDVRSGNDVAPWDPWVSRRMRTQSRQKKDFRDIASSASSGNASRCPLAGSSPKLSLAQGDPVNVLLLLHQLLT